MSAQRLQNVKSHTYIYPHNPYVPTSLKKKPADTFENMVDNNSSLER